MTIREGFDKRHWNGLLTEDNAKHFKFVGIKVSQGLSWNPADRAVLQKQWKRAYRVYGLLRLPFHYLLSPVIGQDAKLYGELQAQNFYNTMKNENLPEYTGWGELPPGIDVENRFVGMAGGKKRAQNLKACLEETEILWDRVPMIYTATWYWDKYIHPWFVEIVPEYWKKYELWEADPLPDTKIAGWGNSNSIQQIALDVPYPGFAGNVDINETTQEWLDSHTQIVPIPGNCDAEVEAALEEQRKQLEGEHLVDLEIAKKAAYNLAIDESTNAVVSLRKGKSL